MTPHAFDNNKQRFIEHEMSVFRTDMDARTHGIRSWFMPPWALTLPELNSRYGYGLFQITVVWALFSMIP